MQVIQLANYDAVSKRAALVIAGQIAKKPDCILGLATGSTPVGAYQELIHLYETGMISFAQVKSYNLDEYCGLEPTHPESYRYFMNEKLFDHVDIAKEDTHVPSGISSDPEKTGRDYDASIAAAGGIDLLLLGIGGNGHIGFNEPAESFSAGTQVVSLTPETIRANSRFFSSEDEVPKKAISMGIGSIMKAKSILLIASGPSKKEALEQSLYAPVTPKVPASILQYHPDVTVIYCN